eukprot:augustus_masked-scaffold_7-processed-gene-19.96-mRNA-1 protein AED:1.00 eAED:1.00 QI:0/-1/0/0/-1/1/1/0/1696
MKIYSVLFFLCVFSKANSSIFPNSPEEFQTCVATHRCPRAYTKFNETSNDLSFESAAFINGNRNSAGLYADFQNWKQGSKGWSTLLDHSHLYGAIKASNVNISSFDYPLLPELYVKVNETIVFNTSNFSAYVDTSCITYNGSLFVSSSGVEVAVFNFIAITLEGDVSLVGDRPISLLSRTSIRINTSLSAAPATLGGFNAGQDISFYNEWGPDAAAFRVVMLTLKIQGPSQKNRAIEVQQVKVLVTDGETARGSFSLCFKQHQTVPIYPDDSVSQVQRVLNEFEHVIGRVAVTKPPNELRISGLWLISFMTYIGNPPQFEVCENKMQGIEAGVNVTTLQEGYEIQGYFRLGINGSWTGKIEHNASSLELRNVLLLSFQQQLIEADVQRYGIDSEFCASGLCQYSRGPSGEYQWILTLKFSSEFLTSNNSVPRFMELAVQNHTGQLEFASFLCKSFFNENLVSLAILPGHHFEHSRSFYSLSSLIRSKLNVRVNNVLSRSFLLYKEATRVSRNISPLTYQNASHVRQNLIDRFTSNEIVYSFVTTSSAGVFPKQVVYHSCGSIDPFIGGSGGEIGVSDILREAVLYPKAIAKGGKGGGVISLIAEIDIIIDKASSLNVSGEHGFAGVLDGGDGQSGRLVLQAGGSVLLPQGMFVDLVSDDHQAINKRQAVLFVVSHTFSVVGVDIIEKFKDKICVSSVAGPNIFYQLVPGGTGFPPDGASCLRAVASPSQLLVNKVIKSEFFPFLGPIFEFKQRAKITTVKFFSKVEVLDELQSYHTAKTTLSFGLYNSEAEDLIVIGGEIVGEQLYIGHDFKPTQRDGFKKMPTVIDLSKWHEFEFWIYPNQSFFDFLLDGVLINGNVRFNSSSKFDGIGFFIYHNTQLLLDNIFVGEHEGIRFRCPFTPSTMKIPLSTHLVREVREVEQYFENFTEHREFFDDVANNPQEIESLIPNTYHPNHISEREYFAYLNETGILESSGLEQRYFDDETRRPKSSVAPNTSCMETLCIVEVTDSDIFERNVSSRKEFIWLGAVLDRGLELLELKEILKQNNSLHRIGGIGVCASDDAIIFRSEGLLLNFVNLSYTGGVPSTDIVLNTGFNKSSSWEGSDVKLRRYKLSLFGLWSNELLFASQPQIVFNNNHFVLWMLVTDAFTQYLNGSTELHLGTVGVASASSFLGSYTFRSTFLPKGNYTFDHTLRQFGNDTFFIFKYHTTVDYILPDRVMQPHWQEVVNDTGNIDFALTYHRSYYHEGYDDINDICSQRMRKEDTFVDVINRNITQEKFLQDYHDYYTPNKTKPVPIDNIVYNGLGNPPVETRFKDPRKTENNLFRPSSVEAVQAQDWLHNYLEDNINDNPIHSTPADQRIGFPTVVYKRKATYIAVALVNKDLLTLGPLLKIIEGSVAAMDSSRNFQRQPTRENTSFSAEVRSVNYPHQTNSILNYDSIYLSHDAYMNHLFESLKGTEYIEEPKPEVQLSPVEFTLLVKEPNLRNLFSPLAKRISSDEDLFTVIFGDLSMQLKAALTLNQTTDTQENTSTQLVGHLYNKSYFPRVCSSEVEVLNYSTKPEYLMKRNKLHLCNAPYTAHELSTDPGQVWAVSHPFNFSTSNDFIHKYHQYYLTFGDRSNDVVNYLDQIEEHINKTNTGRAFFREYDHNCFRGPNNIPEGTRGHIPADENFQAPLSQYYTKSRVVNISETTAHLKYWNP